MPTGAVLLVRLDQALPESELDRCREALVRDLEIASDDFRAGGPLLSCEEEEALLPDASAPGGWLDVNLWQAFYSPACRRGDIVLMVAVAEWIEHAVPGAEVWYGARRDYAVTPFTPARRAELLADYSMCVPVTAGSQ